MYLAGMTANDTSDASIVHRRTKREPEHGNSGRTKPRVAVSVVGEMRNLRALWFAGCGLALAATAALEWTGFDLFLPYLVER